MWHWTEKRNCSSTGQRGCWALWTEQIHIQNYGHIQYPRCLAEGDSKRSLLRLQSSLLFRCLGSEADFSGKITPCFMSVLSSFWKIAGVKHSRESLQKLLCELCAFPCYQSSRSSCNLSVTAARHLISILPQQDGYLLPGPKHLPQAQKPEAILSVPSMCPRSSYWSWGDTIPESHRDF